VFDEKYLEDVSDELIDAIIEASIITALLSHGNG